METERYHLNFQRHEAAFSVAHTTGLVSVFRLLGVAATVRSVNNANEQKD